MATRLALQSKLEELLGVRHVYYQPPENLKMEYPAIRYSRKRPDTKHADDKKYLVTNCYKLIVISTSPDNSVISKLLNLPMCNWDEHYVSNDLHHDVLTLYF